MNWARQVSGRGRPLVLLHGWGMESRVFASWRSLLDTHFTCISYDLPGHGQTPCAPSGLAWSASLESLRQMLAQEAPKPLLLGWSLGGLLALGIALQHPELLAGLVLVSSSPAFCQRPDWSPAIPAATLEDFAQRLRVDPQGTRRRFLALQVLNDPQGRRVLEGLSTSWPMPDQACLADGLGLLREVDLRSQLRRVPMPVHIVHGRQDRIVPVGAGEYLHQHLTGSRFTLLEQAGHAPFLSHPEACANALLETWG
ncbi:pimeloyl-ACP methyl ester esterase BioH [Acidithiobacillus ferrooxidans]|uniref:pimeloyl-ACP methyl ester esterase BioH n=1 Tax=Acidithiobacillus ferrooxidans TaxID=920 RepID=UPI0013D1EA89|nr:pimeloyl-ACP methyl ester esterase BioH [Acidithiobacillus ferrooxidans]MCR2829806.1 pimeloyl-ACP methyl ester esterase BioH [Acidithiobacillus ferrooxidans]